MNFLILTMMFHTYMSYLLDKSKEQAEEMSSVKAMESRSQINLKTYVDFEQVARQRNLMGKIIFPVLVVFCQLIFWSIAMNEYMKPAETYI